MDDDRGGTPALGCLWIDADLRGVSPSLTGGDVLLSLAIYVAAYVVIFGTGLLVILRIIQSGPATNMVGSDRRIVAASMIRE